MDRGDPSQARSDRAKGKIMYINHTAQITTVNTFAKPGIFFGDLADVIVSIVDGSDCACSIEDIQSAVHALEDGEFLSTVPCEDEDALQNAVEYLHSRLTEIMKASDYEDEITAE